jgi:predicted NAD/FAD-dependent oxidoreductase
MNTLARTMAAGLNVQRSVHVHHIAAAEAGYTLHDAEGQTLGSADAVLLTPPGPQTADIIAASHIDADLRDALLDELSAASYRRCLSIALAYPRRVPVPWYALVNHDRQHPIAWLACEHDKPGHVPDDIGVMLAQMGHEFSTAHWDDAEKGTYGEAGAPLPPYMVLTHEYVQALLDTDLGPPLWADLHRWRYALPANGADFERLNSTGSGLYFAGDYVNRRGRVHEAIERGWQVAEQIAQ